jgi:hypothetical protein
MKISQGFPLCSYFKEEKMTFIFPFTKIREQECTTGLFLVGKLVSAGV